MKKIFLTLCLTIGLSAICFGTQQYYSGYGSQKLDTKTGSAYVIDETHALIHEGKVYSVSRTTQTLANSTSAQFVIDLTSGTITDEVHLTGLVTVSGAAIVDLCEDSVFLTTGTNITAYNRNRASTNTYQAGIVLSVNPVSVTSLGTNLEGRFIGSGSGPFAIGDTGRSNEEWVLKPGKLYLINISNISGGNITINTVLEFYETE